MDEGTFGSFASGFISGGASAVFMSGAMKGLSSDDLTDSQRTSLAFKAALIGGGACLMTGGNFLKGALFGYNIAMFNYTEGETVTESFPVSPNMCVTRFAYYSGNVCAELPEFTVVGNIPNPPSDSSSLFNLVINGASYTNTFIDSFGKGLERYSGNSTYGSNGKVYWKKSTQRPFVRNQYVTTQRLTTIGCKITSKTGTAGSVILGVQIVHGLVQDGMDYNHNGYTYGYNTVRATVSFGCAWVGMEVGLRLGSHLGGAIGGLFGGVGAIPGSIAGAAIVGSAGAYWGGKAGEKAVDWLYGK